MAVNVFCVVAVLLSAVGPVLVVALFLGGVGGGETFFGGSKVVGVVYFIPLAVVDHLCRQRVTVLCYDFAEYALVIFVVAVCAAVCFECGQVCAAKECAAELVYIYRFVIRSIVGGAVSAFADKACDSVFPVERYHSAVHPVFVF